MNRNGMEMGTARTLETAGTAGTVRAVRAAGTVGAGTGWIVDSVTMAGGL